MNTISERQKIVRDFSAAVKQAYPQTDQYNILIFGSFNSATYYSIKAGKSVSTNTINHLCDILDCEVSDVMNYVKTKDSKNIKKVKKQTFQK